LLTVAAASSTTQFKKGSRALRYANTMRRLPEPRRGRSRRGVVTTAKCWKSGRHHGQANRKGKNLAQLVQRSPIKWRCQHVGCITKLRGNGQARLTAEHRSHKADQVDQFRRCYDRALAMRDKPRPAMQRLNQQRL
jgi:hypothetical protein